VTWDPKARGVKISGKFHTDVWDVIVYALRRMPRNAVISLEEWRKKQELAKDPKAQQEARRLADAKARTDAHNARIAAAEKGGGRGRWRKLIG
jgi:hypothetical protein